MPSARWLAATTGASLLLLLTGCATPHTRVLLLPQQDGTPSAVAVAHGGGEQVLNKPYQRLTIPQGGRGASTLDQTDAAAVQSSFPALLALRPAPPRHFVLHFMGDGTTLTSESLKQLQLALDELRQRSGAGLVVVGHTDTVGRPEANDLLALERARAVRALLVARGIPAPSIDIAGRGSRDPTVPTADQVNEPRNRRVTIEVR